MPIVRPESPSFVTPGERKVWELLIQQPRTEDVLLANVRITDSRKDHEIDIVVVLPGVAVVTGRGEGQHSLVRR